MRLLLLLAVTCLVAVFSQNQDSDIEAGAKKATFLNEVQNKMIEKYKEFFPDGQRFNDEMSNAIETVKNDLCTIKEGRHHPDLNILGEACKTEFIKLYTEDAEQCSGVFCDVTSDAETMVRDTMRALITAKTDDDFFGIIKSEIINPLMKYSCKCSMKMLGAWLKCKQTIDEGDIWTYVLNFGDFNLDAEYLEGQAWKDYWVNVFVNGIPWDSIERLLERTMANLCQKNSDLDKKAKPKCYAYFFDAFTKLYEVYLEVTGKKAAGLNTGGSLTDCTTYDMYSEEEMENMSFSDIKEAVVAKFCEGECKETYQQYLLGCCSASMIQDTVLQEAVINTIEGLPKILFEVLSEDLDSFDITEYLQYYQDVLQILRKPTCKNKVSYNVIPCPCVGKEGKKLKKCKKQLKGDRTEA